MKARIILFSGFVLLFSTVKAQLFPTTIKQGPDINQVNVYMKPDFSNSTEYLLQLQFAIGYPASASPQPSSATVTLDPGFVTNFVGSTYSVSVTSGGHNTGVTDTIHYFTIQFNRTAGSAAQNTAAQNWTSGTEYPVMTVKFNSGTTPAALANVRVLDYQDAGSDGGGNTYVVTGSNIYYYDFVDSRNNFYGTAGQSVAAGVVAGGYVQTVALISLPVNLLNFSGYKNGGKNVLNWAVSNEVNNKGFEVLRSTDGVNYSSIGFVNSQVGGNSNSEVHYTFDDNSPAGKKQYYRLKQVDIDGKSKQSNIVMITRDRPTSLIIGGLFPNPARETVNVIVETPQRDRVTLVLTDMAGKIVKQQVENIDVGSNTVPVNIAKLSSGSYLVKLICQSSDCQTVSAKFNKQ